MSSVSLSLSAGDLCLLSSKVCPQEMQILSLPKWDLWLGILSLYAPWKVILLYALWKMSLILYKCKIWSQLSATKWLRKNKRKKAKRLQTLSKTLDESNGFKVSKADFMIFGIEIICPLWYLFNTHQSFKCTKHFHFSIIFLNLLIGHSQRNCEWNFCFLYKVFWRKSNFKGIFFCQD